MRLNQQTICQYRVVGTCEIHSSRTKCPFYVKYQFYFKTFAFNLRRFSAKARIAGRCEINKAATEVEYKNK
uniref:Uncharacterized protein n=1 Tax=Tetranychus urticae TaxID=32264 RepID=A0A158P4M9_TETUR